MGLIKGYKHLGEFKKGDIIIVGLKPCTFDHYEITKTKIDKDSCRSNRGYEDELTVEVSIYVKERKEPFIRSAYDTGWGWSSENIDKIAKDIGLQFELTDDDLKVKYLNKENQKKVKEYIKKLIMEENGWK